MLCSVFVFNNQKKEEKNSKNAENISFSTQKNHKEK